MYFLRERILFGFFWQTGTMSCLQHLHVYTENFIFHVFLEKDQHNIMFVTPIRIYRKYHIFMHFLRKIIFQFSSKEKISCFQGEEIPSFQIIQERSYSSAIFLKRPSFQNILRKDHISMCFFRKIIFHIPSKS